MNINIQLNDNETGKAAVVTSSNASLPAADATDSGACKAISSVESAVASADVLDIGAPPQWLSDAMVKKSDTPDADSSQTESNSDGGNAPFFSN